MAAQEGIARSQAHLSHHEPRPSVGDRSVSRGRFRIPAEDLRSLYGGDLLTRPKLTGDWDGLHTKLAKRGITIDVDVLQTYQGVVDREHNEDDAYGGIATAPTAKSASHASSGPRKLPIMPASVE